MKQFFKGIKSTTYEKDPDSLDQLRPFSFGKQIKKIASNQQISQKKTNMNVDHMKQYKLLSLSVVKLKLKNIYKAKLLQKELQEKLKENSNNIEIKNLLHDQQQKKQILQFKVPEKNSEQQQSHQKSQIQNQKKAQATDKNKILKIKQISKIDKKNVEQKRYFGSQGQENLIEFETMKKDTVQGRKRRFGLMIGSTKQPLASRFINLITGDHYTKTFRRVLRYFQKSDRSMDTNSFKFWLQNYRKKKKNLNRVYCQQFINQFSEVETQFIQVLSKEIIHRVYHLMFETNLRNKEREKKIKQTQFLQQHLKNKYDKQQNLGDVQIKLTKKDQGEVFIQQQQNQKKQNQVKRVIENIDNLESNQQLPFLDQQGKKKLQQLFNEVYYQCSESFNTEKSFQNVICFKELKQKIIDKMKYHLNIKRRQEFRDKVKKKKTRKQVNKKKEEKLQNYGIQPQKQIFDKLQKSKRLKRIKTVILIKKNQQFQQTSKNQQLDILKNKEVQKVQFHEDEPKKLGINNQSYIQRLIKKVTKYHYNKNYAVLKKSFFAQIEPGQNGQISLDSFKMRLNAYFPKCTKSEFLQSFGNINQQRFVKRIYQRGMQRVLGLMYESELRMQKQSKDKKKTYGLDAIGRQKLYNSFDEIFDSCYEQISNQINGFKLEPSKQYFKELLIKRLITQ